MGRQFRAPRRGNLNKFVTPAPVIGVTSLVIQVPNYGVTDVSTWAAGEYILDAPEEGVEKTIISVSGTSVARIIRTATDASVKLANGLTSLVFGQTTVDVSITMVGVNSTRWCITSAAPVTSSGAGISLST
jgi:hypothetical protein